MTGNHEKAKMFNSATYGKCSCSWYVEPHGEIIPEYDPDCPEHGPELRLVDVVSKYPANWQLLPGSKHRYKLQSVTPRNEYWGARYCFRCACGQTASMERYYFWAGRWEL
jgi:hypothetical protein